MKQPLTLGTHHNILADLKACSLHLMSSVNDFHNVITESQAQHLPDATSATLPTSLFTISLMTDAKDTRSAAGAWQQITVAGKGVTRRLCTNTGPFSTSGTSEQGDPAPRTCGHGVQVDLGALQALPLPALLPEVPLLHGLPEQHQRLRSGTIAHPVSTCKMKTLLPSTSQSPEPMMLGRSHTACIPYRDPAHRTPLWRGPPSVSHARCGSWQGCA